MMVTIANNQDNLEAIIRNVRPLPPSSPSPSPFLPSLSLLRSFPPEGPRPPTLHNTSLIRPSPLLPLPFSSPSPPLPIHFLPLPLRFPSPSSPLPLPFLSPSPPLPLPFPSPSPPLPICFPSPSSPLPLPFLSPSPPLPLPFPSPSPPLPVPFFSSPPLPLPRSPLHIALRTEGICDLPPSQGPRPPTAEDCSSACGQGDKGNTGSSSTPLPSDVSPRRAYVIYPPEGPRPPTAEEVRGLAQRRQQGEGNQADGQGGSRVKGGMLAGSECGEVGGRVSQQQSKAAGAGEAGWRVVSGTEAEAAGAAGEGSRGV
ncbi:unnamed protein product [Closterium sp. Naga37s-1]|nr:unnamed protein product [Closterium sp. Naga37s-1]